MSSDRSGTPCPDCGTTLRLDVEKARYYCDRCMKYITAPQERGTQEKPTQKPAPVSDAMRRKTQSPTSAGIFIFLGLASFVYGVVQAIQAGNVETVAQQIVWANLGTQTMIGLLLAALGVMIKRLDVLVERQTREPPAGGKPGA